MLGYLCMSVLGPLPQLDKRDAYSTPLQRLALRPAELLQAVRHIV